MAWQGRKDEVVRLWDAAVAASGGGLNQTRQDPAGNGAPGGGAALADPVFGSSVGRLVGPPVPPRWLAQALGAVRDAGLEVDEQAQARLLAAGLGGVRAAANIAAPHVGPDEPPSQYELRLAGNDEQLRAFLLLLAMTVQSQLGARLAADQSLRHNRAFLDAVSQVRAVLNSARRETAPGLDREIGAGVDDVLSYRTLGFLTGAGGTGKSAALFALRAFLERTTPAGSPLPAVYAGTTGLAAAIIVGATVHTTVGITPSTSTEQMVREPGAGGRALWLLRHILVVDEASVQCLRMLGVLDLRLRALTGRDLPFGGVHVVLVGDFAQLSPVGGVPLWSEPADRPNQDVDVLTASGYSLFRRHLSWVVSLVRGRRFANARWAEVLVPATPRGPTSTTYTCGSSGVAPASQAVLRCATAPAWWRSGTPPARKGTGRLCCCTSWSCATRALSTTAAGCWCRTAPAALSRAGWGSSSRWRASGAGRRARPAGRTVARGRRRRGRARASPLRTRRWTTPCCVPSTVSAPPTATTTRPSSSSGRGCRCRSPRTSRCRCRSPTGRRSWWSRWLWTPS